MQNQAQGHTLTITALGRLRQDNVEFETSFGCLPDLVFNPAGSCNGRMKGLVGEAMDKRVCLMGRVGLFHMAVAWVS